MYYVTGLLNHLKGVQACIAVAGGEAFVDARDLTLEVHIGPANLKFLPQFVQWHDGRRSYTPTFSDSVRSFIGWRPHAARRWPATANKLVFKEHAQAAGVRIPNAWSEPSGSVRQYLVKQHSSSFGQGIRGPFERISPDDPLHRLAAGEFYEAFIPGRIAKAWYLAGAWLCLELRPPPFVTGDGRSTLLELAAERRGGQVEEGPLSWIVAAQGHRLSSVPESGKRVVVDFKYGSFYDTWTFDNENVVTAVRDSAVGVQFEQAGHRLLGAIPPDMRNDTLFTLDAVVDAQDLVWFLEMNSNPMVHPDAYPAILNSAFGSRPLLPQTEVAASAS
jgi:hypothetical protein